MVELDELISALMDHPTKFVGVNEAVGSIEDILKRAQAVPRPSILEPEQWKHRTRRTHPGLTCVFRKRMTV
jgi:hypothetical protein